MSMSVTVLIPAHDEAAYLPACLDALLASDPVPSRAEVIVIANGCTDNTAEIARGFEAAAINKGWTLSVLDVAQGGKLGAWNAGEAAASGDVLIYLDADVHVSPPLIAEIAKALSGSASRYASGVPKVTITGQDAITRHFTRFWQGIPFMTCGVPGFGVFAMNRAGRARWGDWPDIISDDTFARLNFTPAERVGVSAPYDWPMIEGFKRLVQVRRRQDAGVAEIAARYPALMGNDDGHDGAQPLWRRAVADPVGFAAFAAVRITVRLPIWQTDNRWVRGR
ncbi:MAG: glycosyltransferase family 2 protein [Sulfitobacter sp.]